MQPPATPQSSASGGSPPVSCSWRFFFALCCVLFLVLNSVGQSQYARYAYGQLSFRSYYFLCWFTFVFTTLVFPLYVMVDFVRFAMCHRRRMSHAESAKWGSTLSRAHPSIQEDSAGPKHALDDELTVSLLSASASASAIALESTSSSPSAFMGAFVARLGERLRENPRFSVRHVVVVAVALALFNFFSSYMWYISLDLIPVAINTTLYKSSVIFVFVLSAVILRERITPLKLGAVALCVVGVALVGLGNALGTSDPRQAAAAGYVLVLASALIWALYEVTFRARVGAANTAGVLLVVSLMGATVLLLLWPPLLILPHAGAEPTPAFSPLVWRFLFVNTGFAVTYYLAYALGIALSSAVYMSVSGLLTVPVAGVVDALLLREHFAALSIVGMCLVFVSVLAINVQTLAPGVLRQCAPLLVRECCAREGTRDHA